MKSLRPPTENQHLICCRRTSPLSSSISDCRIFTALSCCRSSVVDVRDIEMSRRLHLVGLCVLAVALSPSSFAADADHGEALAKRFCTACHVVERDQTGSIDHAPPFASVAKIPDFD